MIIVHKSRLQLSNELRYNQRRTELLNATGTGLSSITKCAETKQKHPLNSPALLVSAVKHELGRQNSSPLSSYSDCLTNNF